MKARLLFACPDIHVLDLLQRLFRAQGHSIQIATDALQCLDVLRDSVPDVVVLDSQLPWGGCEGVIAVIQEDLRMSSTRIIVLGPEQQPAQAWPMGESPPVEYIARPFRMTTLMNAIEGVHAN